MPQQLSQMKTTQYKNATKHEGSAFAVLSYLVHDVVNQTIKDKKTCLIVLTIFELGDTDEQVNKLVTAKVLEGIFKDLIQKAKDGKEIRDQVVPEVAARYILASFSVVVFTSITSYQEAKRKYNR